MCREVIVYCDESGNTGPNYLDPEQPFYVLAGWSIPINRLADVAAAVEKARQTHCPGGELKSSRLLRRPSGVRAAIALLEQLGQLHCVPLYVAAEKRFCVAGKIVETFMDPMFNDRVENPFIPDVITKQEIANALYDHLPADVFDGFAAAYRSPTGEAFRASLTSIVVSVEQRINPELAAALEGCRPYLDQIARLEADTSILGSVQQMFNMPALTSLLMMIEVLGRWGLVEVRKIVHDEHAKYDESYREIFEIHRNAGEGFYSLPNGANLVCPLKHIGGFEIAVSHENPFLPAADILAGAARTVFCKAHGGVEPTADEVRLSEFILPPLLRPDPKIAWLIASDQLLRKLGKAYFRHYGAKGPAREGAAEVRQAGPVDAPVFPVRQKDVKALDPPPGARKLDLPLFALIGRESDAPMLLRMPEEEVPCGTDSGFLTLFSNRAAAEDWLASYEEGELTEEHEVESFGPAELGELVEMLEAMQRWTGTIWLDPGSPDGGLMDLPRFAGDLRRMFERMVRVFSGGFGKEIVQWREISGKRVCTVLGSDGRYGAFTPPDGTIYFGPTREEAVEALKGAEQL
jgi:hypothetical protein